jgi:hypothetical protein
MTASKAPSEMRRMRSARVLFSYSRRATSKSSSSACSAGVWVSLRLKYPSDNRWPWLSSCEGVSNGEGVPSACRSPFVERAEGGGRAFRYCDGRSSSASVPLSLDRLVGVWWLLLSSNRPARRPRRAYGCGERSRSSPAVGIL